MRNQLSEADYARVLACIEAVHRCRDIQDFPQLVLTEMGKLIDCTLSGYNEVNLVRNRIVALVHPPQPGFENLLGEFATLMHEHPVITYFDHTGDGQALKISDFLGVRDYHQRDIYRKVYRHMAVEDQIAIGVRIDRGFMIGIAFARNRRTFTEKDRIRLNLMRPHIMQAYMHAAELAEHHDQQRDLQAALNESGVGVISLNWSGAINHATPGAFDCLSRYLPVPDSESASLPQTLEQWALSKDQGPEDGGPLIVPNQNGKLIVRRVRGEDRVVLLLSEKIDSSDTDRLARYHLTPREHEVLKWIAESKSNSEIATILGLTVGTVKLHVERILAKLGVENRTAAALLARSGFA